MPVALMCYSLNHNERWTAYDLLDFMYGRADPNIMSETGFTSLILAAAGGHLEVVKTLVEKVMIQLCFPSSSSRNACRFWKRGNSLPPNRKACLT